MDEKQRTQDEEIQYLRKQLEIEKLKKEAQQYDDLNNSLPIKATSDIERRKRVLKSSLGWGISLFVFALIGIILIIIGAVKYEEASSLWGWDLLYKNPDVLRASAQKIAITGGALLLICFFINFGVSLVNIVYCKKEDDLKPFIVLNVFGIFIFAIIPFVFAIICAIKYQKISKDKK